MGHAVLAEGLRKRFDRKAALDGFDLAVPAGTVCGLLGPNGAGKTTAVRILATLLRLDGGRAEVAGHDVVREAPAVRRQVALNGQQSTVDAVLTGRENLVMWGRLYHLSRRQAEARADELLEQFGLTGAADKRAKHYSGGMRRRLDLASSFITRPSVLFLDEPTTGLDPRNRGEVWREVKRVVAEGTTVLLTTQYLDEADQLADQIVVLDTGRVAAQGTPDQLKSKLGGDRIEVVVRTAEELPLVRDALGPDAEVDADGFRVSAAVADRVAALTRVTSALASKGVEAEDIALRRPTLDEVFLAITGHKATEVPA
ncbi:daunorubicin resistance protein DrrA family ABC transporter ATP-binding protein [Lentzea aerocolonigenes]|uniref:daunorubicin resistance protein DrrA family ABC transporter ATP-binding protein n=1 Tax=Lentzea aerocolonigenes TaxID=68170 RepID=UPI0004C45DC3|nr:daunorubicin resistance protein DrrA family ABC transporter ATP-binding protein [Lentzea aerocolonigenes]MCP2244942.1 ABC-2 type transport system ATP-binding protein [Lentzea aerocolonigenes]